MRITGTKDSSKLKKLKRGLKISCSFAVILPLFLSSAQANPQKNNTSLLGYTPPPMFGGVTEEKSKPIKITPKVLREKFGQENVVIKPSPRDLLGYKDLAYETQRVVQFPIPKRKPVFTAKLEEKSIEKVAAMKPKTVKPSDLSKAAINEPLALNKASAQAPIPLDKPEKRNSKTKLINEDSIQLMPEQKRKALVEMVLTPPSLLDPKTNKESQETAQIEPKKPMQKSEDPRSLASLLKNKARVIEHRLAIPKPENKQEVADVETLEESTNEQIKTSNEEGKESAIDKAYKKMIEPVNLLRPPQEMLDDVDSEEIAMASPRIIDIPNESTHDANTSDTSTELKENLVEETDVVTQDEDIAAVMAQKEPAAAGPSFNQVPIIRSDLQLPFETGQTELSSEHKSYIREKLVSPLQKDPSARIEIKSFANHVDESQSGARRVSLARALAVREYIMSLGIEAERMDLRALGDQAGIGEKIIDRIEINFTNS